MTFLSGLSDALVPEIQEITKERRRRGRPEEKFKTDIFSAIRDVIQRPTTADAQSISDSLEAQAAGGRFGRNPNLNVLTEGQVEPRVSRADKGAGFLEALSKANIGGISSEGITFRQPGTDISTLLTAMLLGQGGNTPGVSQPSVPVQESPQQATEPQPIPRGQGLESLPVVNRAVGLGREIGRGIGAREVQRGITQSLQARATPALKALGEVGVLTDQDVARILGGGFASDSDTVESRFAKRRGMQATFDEKEKVLNNVLSQPLVPQLQSFGSGGRGGNVRYAYPPEQVAARKKAQEQLIQLRQAKALMNQIFDEADRDMPAIGQPAQKGQQISSTAQSLVDRYRRK